MNANESLLLYLYFRFVCSLYRFAKQGQHVCNDGVIEEQLFAIDLIFLLLVLLTPPPT